MSAQPEQVVQVPADASQDASQDAQAGQAAQAAQAAAQAVQAGSGSSGSQEVQAAQWNQGWVDHSQAQNSQNRAFHQARS